MQIRFLLSLLLLSASAALAAQTLRPAYPDVVRRFSTHDGLPQNSVNAMVQDREGFLCLGTFGGLARFDGSDFSVYRNLASSGASSDRILQFSAASCGSAARSPGSASIATAASCAWTSVAAAA